MNKVTFYALQPNHGTVVVAEHLVQQSIIGSYTADPTLTLVAVRKIEDTSRIDGFRVEDVEGRLLLDYRDGEGGTPV